MPTPANRPASPRGGPADPISESASAVALEPALGTELICEPDALAHGGVGADTESATRSDSTTMPDSVPSAVAPTAAVASERLHRARALLAAATSGSPSPLDDATLDGSPEQTPAGANPPSRGADSHSQPARRRREQGARVSRSRSGGGESGKAVDGESSADSGTDPHERARTICLNQLGYSARTRAQLQAVLTKRGIASEVATEVLDRLEEVGLIDDAAFAHAWVRSRHRSKGVSRRMLGQELSRAGIAADEASEALSEVDDESERQAAHALAMKKARTLTGLDPAVAGRRLASLLARKGYAPSLCFDIARQVLAQAGLTATGRSETQD